MIYLSIQNSSNFRELTEKRILEEEKTIHESYINAFQIAIENLTIDLNEFVNLNGDSSQKVNELVANHLIMNENGELVQPLFFAQSFNPPYQQSISLFIRSYQMGEQLEFLGNDFKAAQRNFLTALSRATKAQDSAKVYNALSRLHIKMNQPEKAMDYFEIIITEFGKAKNTFGMAYSYFSANQLLKITDPKLESRKIELLDKFLSNLNLGKIPFAQNTANLLEAFNQSAETSSQLNEHLNHAKRTIRLIENYQSLLYNLQIENEVPTFEKINDFKVFASENSPDQILLTIYSEGVLHGFVVGLTDLDRYVRTSLTEHSTNFEYLIELNEQNSINRELGSKYNFQDGFSPYFPNHELLINIKNVNQVSDFIFRRTLITLIGLGLLLAAMIIGFVMLVRDVARKKNIEKLRADFVANVTHELKTPLTSINMFADSILLDRVQNRKGVKEYAQIILKESEKLKRMINNILEFSRNANAKMHYELKEEQVSHLIHQSMEEMNYWLSLHKFETSLDLNDDLYINVNPEGFKQVMSNLITNAIKYSISEKKIEIRCYKNNQKVCIDIRDRGIGIPQDKLSSIFKKFYRVTENESQPVSGTGLGLTVSKEIIEAMDGTLTVKSTIGQGSTFTITFNNSHFS
jgi:signal transduction histidine kinase